MESEDEDAESAQQRSDCAVVCHRLSWAAASRSAARASRNAFSRKKDSTLAFAARGGAGRVIGHDGTRTRLRVRRWF